MAYPSCRSALSRIRTCDLQFRKLLLYPLSYKGKLAEAILDLRTSDGTRTHTPKHRSLKPACLPFHHRGVTQVGIEPTNSGF